MWEKEYKKAKFYWGLKPDARLVEIVKYAPKGIALDIGAGEGKNSIFLARNGFKVEAIDKIKEGLKKCQKIAQKYNLPIKMRVIDIKKFRFSKKKYSLIFSIASLDFLKFSEIKKIMLRIKESLITGGIVYLSVFTTKDPLFDRIKQLNFKQVEKNTFYFPKGKFYRHFFNKNEIKKNFSNFKIILLQERRFKDTLHNQPHFHQVIEFIAKK